MLRSEHSVENQRGAALLLTMLVVILATVSALLANQSRDHLQTREQTVTRATLATAKSALIDYALVNRDLNAGRSISLPCPDLDEFGGFEDGVAHSSACGGQNVTVMGRLPWKTLGLAPQKDANSVCLWYVVSGTYKDADSERATMINVDSNGQLQLISTDSGSVIAGTLPQDRPVAMVVASMSPVTGQQRSGNATQSMCAPGFDPIKYLESDSGTGVSNAMLGGTADNIDALAMTAGVMATHNDRIITVSRGEIERRVIRRIDFLPEMRQLGIAAASCIANYAATNPGGSDDKRLPWPARVSMTDYRPDASYDDSADGYLAGRLPDIVADSNLLTNNTINRVLIDCDSGAVPEWTAAMRSAWQNWKDNFFYAVAGSYAPTAEVPSACGGCLTVNGGGSYAGLLIFSNTRLRHLGQIRNAPPVDSDTKLDVSNYLEDVNADKVPGPIYTGNNGNGNGNGTGNTGNCSGAEQSIDYASGLATDAFNDLLFCIDEQLTVAEC